MVITYSFIASLRYKKNFFRIITSFKYSYSVGQVLSPWNIYRRLFLSRKYIYIWVMLQQNVFKRVYYLIMHKPDQLFLDNLLYLLNGKLQYIYLYLYFIIKSRYTKNQLWFIDFNKSRTVIEMCVISC